ncbi:MAG: hypothetical protein LEGION0403_FIIPPAGN_01893 [Legionella sp.]
MNKNIFLAPLLGLLSTNILAGTMGDIRPPLQQGNHHKWRTIMNLEW